MDEVLDVLNRLSPDELVILVYHKILHIDIEAIPAQRHRFKISKLDCHKTLNRLNVKRRKDGEHKDKISALQEMFTSDPDGIFR